VISAKKAQTLEIANPGRMRSGFFMRGIVMQGIVRPGRRKVRVTQP